MKSNITLKIAVVLAYIATVFTNYLANALPIGGVTTGQASDNLGNLFTPAGLTFAIWGLIYLLLLGYSIYQLNIGQRKKAHEEEKKQNLIRKYFILSSVANITWIFAWHYSIIWLSVLIMITLILFLIKIAGEVNKRNYSLSDTIFIRLPFSVYFGWITVATIANITAYLVSINWNGFGISEVVWTMIILLVGTGIGCARMFKDRNIYYGLVLVWAYGGIWLKHTSIQGFNTMYPSIIKTVLLCILLFLISLGLIFYKNYISKSIDK